MLFGPREAGCWQILLSQAWLSTLIAGSAAYLTGMEWLRSLAQGFLGEALLISVFLLAVAQQFWLEDRFPTVPDWCWQISWYLGIILFLCLLLAPSIPAVRPATWGLLAFLLGCLLLSVLLRILLALLDRNQPT